MKISVRAAAKSDVGLVRKNKEDAFGYDIRHGIFVACDGMGGQAAGEIASRIAVETVLSYFRHDVKQSHAVVVGKSFEAVSMQAAALANAIQVANIAIQE